MKKERRKTKVIEWAVLNQHKTSSPSKIFSRASQDGSRVVGFYVEPFTVKHKFANGQTWDGDDIRTAPPLTTCDKSGPMVFEAISEKQEVCHVAYFYVLVSFLISSIFFTSRFRSEVSSYISSLVFGLIFYLLCLCQVKIGRVLFTYDVMWRASNVKWASRWDIYLSMDNAVPDKV